MRAVVRRLVPGLLVVCLVAPFTSARADVPAIAVPPAERDDPRSGWRGWEAPRGSEVSVDLGMGGGSWGQALQLGLGLRVGPVVARAFADAQVWADSWADPGPGAPDEEVADTWLGGFAGASVEPWRGTVTATQLRLELGPEAGVHHVGGTLEFHPADGRSDLEVSENVPFIGGAAAATVVLGGWVRGGVRLWIRRDLRAPDCATVLEHCTDLNGATTFGIVAFGGLQLATRSSMVVPAR